MAEPEGVLDLEGRVRAQVDQILAEIRATVPAAGRPGTSLSFEDVAAATARVVVPSLLVDLPLEIERTIRSGEGGTGLSEAERVELLRLIISRLSSEWTDLAGRLAGRLGEVVERAGDAGAVAALRESAARRFREGRSWAVLMGGPRAAAGDGGRAGGGAPPVAMVDGLAEKIAEAVARRMEAVREAAPVPSDLAERVAKITADHLKTSVMADLRRELAEIQDVSARTEAIRAVLRSELERALGALEQSAFRPDEIRTIAAQIAHALGGTLTNWIFGPPRPAGGREGGRRRRPRARGGRAVRRRRVSRKAEGRKPARPAAARRPAGRGKGKTVPSRRAALRPRVRKGGAGIRPPAVRRPVPSRRKGAEVRPRRIPEKKSRPQARPKAVRKAFRGGEKGGGRRRRAVVRGRR